MMRYGFGAAPSGMVATDDKMTTEVLNCGIGNHLVRIRVPTPVDIVQTLYAKGCRRMDEVNGVVRFCCPDNAVDPRPRITEPITVIPGLYAAQDPRLFSSIILDPSVLTPESKCPAGTVKMQAANTTQALQMAENGCTLLASEGGKSYFCCPTNGYQPERRAMCPEGTVYNPSSGSCVGHPGLPPVGTETGNGIPTDLYFEEETLEEEGVFARAWGWVQDHPMLTASGLLAAAALGFYLRRSRR